MDESTKTLVQESWAKVVPISDQAAELFYGRLFELDPSLKFLFKGPIDIQGKLLMKALDGAVAGLDDLESLLPTLQKLGARHAPYGVVDKDYDTVGAAFLWTLGQGLGDEFDDATQAAWTEVYGVLSATMKDAQAEVKLDGPVSARDRRLVQGSWQAVIPISEAAAGIFYARLFELDPALKPLFKAEIKDQGKKLMQMLGVAVKGLDRLEEIVPAVQQLGKRHVEYGVQEEDYETVGEALLFTLDQGLGEAFTEEVKLAWANVYTLLAETMKAAAVQAAEAPTPASSARLALQNKSVPTRASHQEGNGIGVGMVATGLFMIFALLVGYF